MLLGIEVVSETPCLIPGVRALGMMKTMALVSVAFIVLRSFASITGSLTVPILKMHCILSDGFDVSTG